MALMAVSLRVSQTPSFVASVKASNVEQRGHRMNKPMVTVTCADSRKSSRGGGITQPRPISPAMQKFLGVPEIPRTKAIKKIWEYIKENNLQDPANRREILCDESLKSIFDGRERVNFLEIARLMGPHFL
ncbi:hypothetical protein SUGI_0588860 [Cryptomeria japonica]|uniref:protein TRI1 n=1 Tax=Cryptomeria japonica TaxID=3369 RepID=UPI0024146C5A|nr:protein TRI1 [Cryptomeria japonica]GLJ29820.1 hypothetical protein SUGI_0588860 [Cryptomeria japonica]